MLGRICVTLPDNRPIERDARQTVFRYCASSTVLQSRVKTDVSEPLSPGTSTFTLPALDIADRSRSGTQISKTQHAAARPRAQVQHHSRHQTNPHLCINQKVYGGVEKNQVVSCRQEATNGRIVYRDCYRCEVQVVLQYRSVQRNI